MTSTRDLIANKEKYSSASDHYTIVSPCNLIVSSIAFKLEQYYEVSL